MIDHFEPGDLFACYGTGLASKVISYGTVSLFPPANLMIGPSHVAICCYHRGEDLWVESTSLCKHPCLVSGQRIAGVQAHHPEQRIKDYTGEGGKVEVYRLSAIDSLSREEESLMHTILFRYFMGEKYDNMGQLAIAGTRIVRYLPVFGADMHELFCSELCSALLMRLNRLHRANPTTFNPATLLRRLVRTGTYSKVRTYR